MGSPLRRPARWPVRVQIRKRPAPRSDTDAGDDTPHGAIVNDAKAFRRESAIKSGTRRTDTEPMRQWVGRLPGMRPGYTSPRTGDRIDGDRHRQHRRADRGTFNCCWPPRARPTTWASKCGSALQGPEPSIRRSERCPGDHLGACVRPGRRAWRFRAFPSRRRV